MNPNELLFFCLLGIINIVLEKFIVSLLDKFSIPVLSIFFISVLIFKLHDS